MRQADGILARGQRRAFLFLPEADLSSFRSPGKMPTEGKQREKEKNEASWETSPQQPLHHFL